MGVSLLKPPSCLSGWLCVCTYLEGELLLADEGHGPARDLLVAHVPPRLCQVVCMVDGCFSQSIGGVLA